MQLNPYNQYKNTSVQTASPEQLVIMLYDGAIKFLNQAKTAMNAGNIQDANGKIGKTQDIIAELMIALNMDYEISHSLYSLYEYFNRRLIEANIKKDSELLDEVLNHLSELRQTWTEAMIRIKSQPMIVSGVTGVNIEG